MFLMKSTVVFGLWGLVGAFGGFFFKKFSLTVYACE